MYEWFKMQWWRQGPFNYVVARVDALEIKQMSATNDLKGTYGTFLFNDTFE